MKEKKWLEQLDAVTNFSLSKGEPEWMTKFRQEALATTTSSYRSCKIPSLATIRYRRHGRSIQ